LVLVAAALWAAPGPGDVVVFGSYPAGPEGEKQPLEWIVADYYYARPADGAASEEWKDLPEPADTCTLICRYIPETCTREELGAEWETSLLRLRLNTEFEEKCFSPEEREKLLTWTLNEEPVSDKVTLLQGFGDLWVDDGVSVWAFFDGADTRKAEPGPFAAGDIKTENGCLPWALRALPYSAFTWVDSEGVPRSGKADAFDRLGVRPVIKVKKDTPLKVTGHITPPGFTLSAEARAYEKGMALKKGDRVLLGKAEQDGNASNGKEPIEWIVLKTEDKKALVVSKDILYYPQPDYETWEKGSLRSFLNNKFAKGAFSADELALILTSEQKTTDVPAERKTFSSRSRCFVLSAPELTALFPTAEARKSRSSITAGRAADVDDGLHFYEKDCYITRDNGFVDRHGVIDFPHEGGVAYGVRPAMWLAR
ncbi:MAG: hypothetical protein IJT95_02540, partial [Abditibacteriota bacterium]|nr:hypothetical protein [Abditibacteriota bacterium]